MRFEARVFRLAKDPLAPQENQDHFRMDAVRGIAAIADGVTSGIFSGPWAQILTEAVAAAPPDPADLAAFTPWLAELRTRWTQTIDVSQLQWFQRAKMKQGAFSTLLWVEFAPPSDDPAVEPGQMRCTAIGDSCLLHIRANQMLRSFPLEEAEQFQADPLVVGSIDLSRDALLKFEVLEETCEDGDLLALCTDAVAEWALRKTAAGAPPDWESYWHITEESWQDEVVQLRQLRDMRYDDATLILLRVAVPQPVRPSQPAASGAGVPPAPVVHDAGATPVPQLAAHDAGETPAPQPAAAWFPPTDSGVPSADPLSAPASTDIYAIQDEAAPPCSAGVPPASLSADAAITPAPQPTGSQPPPLPPMAGMEDSPMAPVLERAKTILAASEDVAEKMAGGLLRGMQKAEKFLRKYRGKYPPKEDKDERKE
jgi:hypothetical protein